MTAEDLTIDGPAETRRIVEFIRSTVAGASAGGVVVGLSGGIDSSVVGVLCVRALGGANVRALLLPSDHTPKEDVDDAKSLAEVWGVPMEVVKITPIVDEIIGSAKTEGTKMAKANLEARLRMTLEYYHANSLGYLVAGTGDRSEEELGYFTKWGDGGVDFLPIAHLYKTQVRSLGRHLGIPERVVNKPASPQLWRGHRATDEIPLDYDRLDVVLRLLFEARVSPETAAREAGVGLDVVERVLKMHLGSAHKRAVPPSLLL